MGESFREGAPEIYIRTYIGFLADSESCALIECNFKRCSREKCREAKI